MRADAHQIQMKTDTNKLTPSFDKDGYPTEDTLQRIATWPWTDFEALLEYVTDSVDGYGRAWKENDEFRLVTGGWSGNESIVDALQKNTVFWAIYWYSSQRGGLYTFKILKLGKKTK
jgi:hypothetical protein